MSHVLHGCALEATIHGVIIGSCIGPSGKWLFFPCIFTFISLSGFLAVSLGMSAYFPRGVDGETEQGVQQRNCTLDTLLEHRHSDGG